MERRELLKSSIRDFSQSVLDLTYFQETQLASADFVDVGSLGVMVEIIRTLSLPAWLCGSPRSVGVVLGVELLECLYWRVGALFYMYCYSEFGREEKGAMVDRDRFLKVTCVCANGVCSVTSVSS